MFQQPTRVVTAIDPDGMATPPFLLSGAATVEVGFLFNVKGAQLTFSCILTDNQNNVVGTPPPVQVSGDTVADFGGMFTGRGPTVDATTFHTGGAYQAYFKVDSISFPPPIVPTPVPAPPPPNCTITPSAG